MAAEFLSGDGPSSLPGQSLGGGGGGSGDMLKSVYDTDNDGKVDAANEADAITGVGAQPAAQYYGTDVGGDGGFHVIPVQGASSTTPSGYHVFAGIVSEVLKLRTLLPSATVSLNETADSIVIYIPAGAIGNSEIQDNAITGLKVQDGSLGTNEFADNSVTNLKAADMATNTIKGRNTAGTGDPQDLSVAAVTAMLNNFTSTLKGLAPASGGGTTNFLRADGTWAAPPGGGSGPAYLTPHAPIWDDSFGSYVHFQQGCSTRVTASLVANTVYLYPLVPSHNMTLASLCCTVKTAGAGNMRMGIFSSRTDTGAPNAHLGSVVVSVSGTGTQETALGASLSLLAGTQYWIAFNPSVNCGISAVPIANATPIPTDYYQENPATMLRAPFTYTDDWAALGLDLGYLGNQYYALAVSVPVLAAKLI